jgi:hypothetical protein
MNNPFLSNVLPNSAAQNNPWFSERDIRRFKSRGLRRTFGSSLNPRVDAPWVINGKWETAGELKPGRDSLLLGRGLGNYHWAVLL